ncbi:MAG: hypothetical protein WC365_00740 [Candidatus Babeliales bacterium]|jgi:hypothetical protein
MNEAKCAVAPIELLNDIAQEIIDILDKVNSLANVIDNRMYGSSPQPPCDKKEPPANLRERLICIRSQVKEIGDTLETVQAKV